MKNLLPVLLTFLLLSLAPFTAFAQDGTEFFVEINPNDGSVAKIKSIEGVKWIVNSKFYKPFIDPQHHVFYFCGADAFFHKFLYGIDINTGSLISKCDMPMAGVYGEEISSFKYSNRENSVLGFLFTASDYSAYTVKINPITGQWYKKCHLDGFCTPYDDFFLDNEENYYSVDGTFNLRSGNTITGNPLFNTNFTSDCQISSSLFDPDLDSIVTLATPDTSSFFWLCHVSKDGLQPKFIKVNERFDLGVSFTYNYKSHQYIFYGSHWLYGYALTFLNSQTGKIDKVLPFPHYFQFSSNVLYPEYDPATNKIFALSWQANSDNPGLDWLKIRPSLTSENVTIECPHPIQDLHIYTTKGQEVYTEAYIPSGLKALNLDWLSDGMYIVKVRTNYQELNGKFVLMR